MRRLLPGIHTSATDLMRRLQHSSNNSSCSSSSSSSITLSHCTAKTYKHQNNCVSQLFEQDRAPARPRHPCPRRSRGPTSPPGGEVAHASSPPATRQAPCYTSTEKLTRKRRENDENTLYSLSLPLLTAFST